MFEAPADLDEYGFVVANCTVASEVLSCQWGPLDVFLFTPSNVVNGTQTGEIVQLGLAIDGTPFTIKVVPA